MINLNMVQFGEF